MCWYFQVKFVLNSLLRHFKTNKGLVRPMIKYQKFLIAIEVYVYHLYFRVLFKKIDHFKLLLSILMQHLTDKLLFLVEEVLKGTSRWWNKFVCFIGFHKLIINIMIKIAYIYLYRTWRANCLSLRRKWHSNHSLPWNPKRFLIKFSTSSRKIIKNNQLIID